MHYFLKNIFEVEAKTQHIVSSCLKNDTFKMKHAGSSNKEKQPAEVTVGGGKKEKGPLLSFRLFSVPL